VRHETLHVGDIRKVADSDHGLLAGDRHCDRRQEQSKQVEEGLHLLFRGVAVLSACAVPPVIGGDPCQHDSNRTSESASMLGAVRDRVPGVEQFAAFGNLHGKSSELVDFILYAGVPPEQQISPFAPVQDLSRSLRSLFKLLFASLCYGYSQSRATLSPASICP
jgi:hypothetical protein